MPPMFMDELVQGSKIQFIVTVATMVAHFVVIIFTAFIIYTAQPGSSLFSWHPTLMTLAFAFFMMEAILVYSPMSSFIAKAARKTKVTWHWVGMVTALVCALAGVFTIWYNKELHSKPHMTTWHGTLGYGTLAYTAMGCIGGTVVKYPNLVSKWVRYADLKMYHATSGLILFSLSCGTLILGLYSSWFTGLVTGTSWYMCYACPCILALAVMTQVTSSFADRINAARTGQKPGAATAAAQTTGKAGGSK